MPTMQLNLGIVAKLLILLTMGCASHRTAPTAMSPKTLEMPRRVQEIRLDHLVVTPIDADSLTKIHARGMGKLRDGALGDAMLDFELCVRADPTGPMAPSSLYHLALTLDEMGRFEEALVRFQQAAERFPDASWGQAAAIRGVRLASHLERWQVARAIAERVLERNALLRPAETVLIEGSLALDAVFRGDDTLAELHVARARNAIDDNGLDAPGKLPRDIAAVYFALGETRRVRAERIGLVPPLNDFPERLERRCELILAAQSAYSDSMRALDSHWSTMAGYRIGELYASLHQELMRIEAPAVATSVSQRELFEGAMRLRYSVLVQKALNMMKHTVEMAERNAERSEWVARARAAGEELEERLRDEQNAIARLPYSRQSLEYALDRIQQPVARKAK